MEKYLNSEEIFEQFADAAAALVMDQYVTAMQESVAAEAEVPLAEIPEELDQKCRRLIKKKLAKKQRKHVAKKLLRFTRTAVLTDVILFGVVGILFTTVEAVRVPIINFFLEQKDGYLEIRGGDTNSNRYVEEHSASADAILEGLLPADYCLETYDQNSAGGISIMYVNPLGEYIILCVDPYAGTLHVDTEDAVAEYTTISGCEAVLINKDGFQLVWLNVESGQLSRLEATALSREEIINLAENIERKR